MTITFLSRYLMPKACLLHYQPYPYLMKPRSNDIKYFPSDKFYKQACWEQGGGHLSPRALVEAQIKLAKESGCEVK